MGRLSALPVAAAVITACPNTPENSPSRQEEAAAQISFAPLPPFLGARSLPLLPDSVKRPPGYAEAQRRWHTATTAYAQGDARGAAFAFIAAARHLKGAHSEPVARTLRAGRCQAYENAGRCFQAGNDFTVGKEQLLRLGEQDPTCQHSISAILVRMHNAQLNAGPALFWREDSPDRKPEPRDRRIPAPPTLPENLRTASRF